MLQKTNRVRVSAQAKLAGLGVSAALAVALTMGGATVALAETTTVQDDAQTAAVEAQPVEELASVAAPMAETQAAPASVTDDVTPEPNSSVSDVATASATDIAPENADAPAAVPTAGAEAAATHGEGAGQSEAPSAEATESDIAATAGAATARTSDPALADSINAQTQVSNSEATASTQAKAITYKNMFRLYNPNSGEHFYTANPDEAKNVVEAGWRWEGIGWVAPSEGAPVYRLYSGTDHHYTKNAGERDWLITQGWKYEGVGWFSADESDGLPLYRQFNPNVDPSAPRNNSGSHNYTLNKGENDQLVSLGWRAEGIGWYGAKVANQPMKGMWVNTAAWTGSQKELYWIGANGVLAKSRVIDPSANAADAGAGRRAYATETGAVVRGKRLVSNGMMFADQNGTLVDLSKLGDVSQHWIVTGNLDNGDTQRYYITTLKNGQLGALVGDFTATLTGKSSSFHGREDQGYIVRGTWSYGGWIYTADNDGRITSKRYGWNAPGVDSWFYNDTSYVNSMLDRAKRYGSDTDWFVTIDTSRCRVSIFNRTNGTWSAVGGWKSVQGKLVNGRSLTKRGVYKIVAKEYEDSGTLYEGSAAAGGPRSEGNWWDIFYCNHRNIDDGGMVMEYNGHSFLVNQPSPYYSHGGTCISLDAVKFISQHAPVGSTVCVLDNVNSWPSWYQWD